MCDENAAEAAKLFTPRRQSTQWDAEDYSRDAKRFRTLNQPTPESLEEEPAKETADNSDKAQINHAEMRREIDDLCQIKTPSDD